MTIVYYNYILDFKPTIITYIYIYIVMIIVIIIILFVEFFIKNFFLMLVTQRIIFFHLSIPRPGVGGYNYNYNYIYNYYY